MAKLGYPAFPTHPGEIIKDELIARNLSQREFAKVLGISYSVLNEILNGHRTITAKTALLFEASLGIPADAFVMPPFLDQEIFFIFIRSIEMFAAVGIV